MGSGGNFLASEPGRLEHEFKKAEIRDINNIAFKFYRDSNLWHVIARANKDVTGTLYPTQNKVLVIPRID